MTFTQETVTASKGGSPRVLALACTVGLATFVVALGLGLGQSWVSWLGVVWLAAELALRFGVWLGYRIGYDEGSEDTFRQVSAW